MKLFNALAALVLLDTTVWSIAIPENIDIRSIDQPADQQQQGYERDDSSTNSFLSDLWKRRGGGGSGSRGGSSSSSSSGSSGSSSSSSSSGRGGSSSSSSSSSSSGRGSSSSSTGGRTKTGSGVTPSYGGGRYYGGGTTVPYRAGSRSTGGISPLPFLFAGSAIAFWPGLWYHPVYIYPYTNHWNYYNASSAKNETKPVKCGCDAYQECGCDDNTNQTYVDNVLGNGSYDSLNKSLVTVGNVNGTETILLNGTLPNGTTASGGTESASAAAGLRGLAQLAGWWPLVATAVAMVCFA
ncbi:hypothetical protein SLS53_004047 [Cytospora paraplurivora]|uniref:DUF7732 domain-containing protein n=1 Tax=Cytospora paraplurivora TaxID=2898453 RepID=A0AAN9UHF8_9PEZI